MKRPESSYAEQLDRIRRVGWIVYGVDVHPMAPQGYVYTCGLSPSYMARELCVAGLDEQAGAWLLHELAAGVRDARVGTDHKYPAGAYGPAALRLVQVDPSWIGTDMFGMANRLSAGMGEARIRGVLQVVRADEAGRFPGDPDCDPDVARSQPNLARPL